MSIQQVFEVVERQHVFWQSELCRAPANELADCEFFLQQSHKEVVSLAREIARPIPAPAAGDELYRPQKAADRPLSNKAPKKVRMRRRS
jgi:hypothetical protein